MSILQPITTASPLPAGENALRYSVRAGERGVLKLRLRRQLVARARMKLPIDYERLASGLRPIADEASVLRDALERLMEEDVFDGRPFLAALAVSGRGSGLPSPWFFRKAQSLGRFTGDPEGVEAFAFHARELHRCILHHLGNREGSAHKNDQPHGRRAVMLRAKDIMTTPVISVRSDASVGAVANLLTENGISAVPVIDGNALVGIVSEGDLVHRAELGTTSRHRSWWLKLLRDNATLAAEYTKSHSAKVADVMTRDVATVAEITPLAEVARLLDRKRIKRVPVMRFGRVVGIVSRGNLVQALAAATTSAAPVAASADDDTIRSRLLAALKAEPWVSSPNIHLSVDGGVVTFWGTVGSAEERKASQVLAENIQGVRRVEDHRAMLDFPVVAV